MTFLYLKNGDKLPEPDEGEEPMNERERKSVLRRIRENRTDKQMFYESATDKLMRYVANLCCSRGSHSVSANNFV